ncbi:MAG TPA: ABC-2 family transporter protein [Clostridia bacterium]|nr:ABC-2 family transporter protein [Clostridia bacterium]
MDRFVAVIKTSFKQQFQYRWTFAVSIFTQPILLLLNLILFKSIYSFNGTDVIKGYSLEQMVWYFTSFMVVNSFVWNAIAREISYNIISGDMAIDLLRPMPYFRVIIAESVASRIIAQVMDLLPGMVIYSLIIFPYFLTPVSILRFLPVVLLAAAINHLYSFMLGMTAMSLKNNNSIIWLNDLFIYVAGGALIPMEFYPGWLNAILDFLPFKYIIYWPIQFFLNKESTWQAGAYLRILGLQLFWVIILYIGSKIMWRTLVKKFCSAGG